MQEQFDKIFKKLDGMETYMHEKLATKQALSEVENRMVSLENRLDGRMTKLQDRLDNRMTKLQDRLDNRMTGLEGTTDTLTARLLGFESYVHENMVTKKEAGDTKAEIMSHIDLLAQRGNLHEDERLASTVRFERVEDRVTRLEHRGSPS